MDIYIDLKAVTTDLLDQTLHGRYCGNDLGTLPHLLISLHNELIVGFYTDDENRAKGFLAEYKFIDACKCRKQHTEFNGSVTFWIFLTFKFQLMSSRSQNSVVNNHLTILFFVVRLHIVNACHNSPL